MRSTAQLISTIVLAASFGCGGRASGTNSSSGSGGSDSGSESGTDDTLDGKIPDAFPTACAQFTFVLDPDAAAHSCAFTPADVACNSNADCFSYVKLGCGCFFPVYGVNGRSAARCYAPPCVPLGDSEGGLATCPSDASGLYTQDCQFVPSMQSVAVACIEHQCLTYAVAPGSE